MESWLIRITDYLLAQSWQIAVLTIAVALATFALRNRSAHVRYLLWLIVLAKALVPPLYSIPIAVFPERAVSAFVPAPPIDERMNANYRVSEAVVTESARPSLIQSHAAPSPKGITRPAKYDARAWLAIGWLAGFGALSFYYLLNALRTQIWLQRRRVALSSESASNIGRFFAAHGVKRWPRVWLLERTSQPFVWGLVRGSIYLPSKLLDGERARFQASLLGHELNHVVRLDAMVNSLQVVAQSMFWFHPFVWWANRRIRAEREKCCDEMTIARLNTLPEEYGEAIVEALAAKYEQARPVPSLAVAGQVKNIEERINTMLKPGKRFYRRPSLVAAATLLLMAVLTVPSAVVLTARGESNMSAKTATALPFFGNATNLGPVVNTVLWTWDPHISPDGLSLYFNTERKRSDGSWYYDVWVTTRNTKEDVWGQPVELEINTDAFEGAPSLSADGLEMYFVSDRPGGSGSVDIWVTERKSKDSPWGAAANLGPTVNCAAAENGPSISADGLELYFSEAIWSTPSPRTGGMGSSDIWVTERKTKDGPWGTPVNLGPAVNTSAGEASPSVSKDGLSLYFMSMRGYGGTDIWVTTRKTKDDPWGTAVNLGPTVNTMYNESNPDISSDGSTLYFVSGRPGSQGTDIWQVSLETKVRPTESLHQAAAYGDIEQVKSLVSKGADLSVKDEDGNTALHHAVINGHKEIVRFLHAKDADVNEGRKNGFTPLGDAARNGYKDIVETLIAKGVNVNIPQGKDQWTPLHGAADQGFVEVARLLLAQGADVNIKGAKGETPLHLSARRCYRDMAELLLANGADIDAANGSGRTPLDIAIERGHIPLVELLKKHGIRE
jgi:beta-lactamase regulating signal transducer with metallopeptidase domain